MLRCALLSISAVLFSGPGLLGEDSKAAEARPEKAPWQRRLQAEDRKRVEELQKQFDALREAGKYTDALTPAREIFTIRTRGQGADHWETIYAKWQVKTLERILATPVFDALRLQRADWQQAQAERLLGQGKYAEVESLLVRALEVFEQQFESAKKFYLENRDKFDGS